MFQVNGKEMVMTFKVISIVTHYVHLTLLNSWAEFWRYFIVHYYTLTWILPFSASKFLDSLEEVYLILENFSNYANIVRVTNFLLTKYCKDSTDVENTHSKQFHISDNAAT